MKLIFNTYLYKCALVTILLLFKGWELYAQCAMCKAAAASKDDSGNFAIGAGINAGILYLLALPFIGIGIVGFYWYKKNKEKRWEEKRTHEAQYIREDGTIGTLS